MSTDTGAASGAPSDSAFGGERVEARFLKQLARSLHRYGMPVQATRGFLLVMRPHAEHMDKSLVAVDSIDESMLHVDAAGVVTGEVPHQLLEAWRCGERIGLKQLEQPLSLRSAAGPSQSLGVLGGPLAQNNLPCHQSRSSSFVPSSRGSAAAS